MMTARDAWILATLAVGRDVNGQVDDLAQPFKAVAARMAAAPVDRGLEGPDRDAALAAARKPMLDDFLADRTDRDELVRALADADPDKPPPEADTPARTATLADVRRLVADTAWPWKGWLCAGVLNALAADPGTGKTILAADLARRLYFGLDWPDGQAATMPSGTRTLWVPGDRHYVQMFDLAANLGLPDEAILLNAGPVDPTAGLDLDEPDERAALKSRIQSDRPGLVIVDTVGMTTALNLCRPEDARAYFGPLMDMAAETGVPFLMLTHLSKDGQALGRRIDGACRTVWKLTHPDPDGQPDRRRFWVHKTYAVKPPPLGMTIALAGCTFDFNPPAEPEPEARRPGPTPARLAECKAWLADRLAAGPDRVKEIRDGAESAGYGANTLYKARDAIQAEEFESDRRKWWRLPTTQPAV